MNEDSFHLGMDRVFECGHTELGLRLNLLLFTRLVDHVTRGGNYCTLFTVYVVYYH